MESIRFDYMDEAYERACAGYAADPEGDALADERTNQPGGRRRYDIQHYPEGHVWPNPWAETER